MSQFNRRHHCRRCGRLVCSSCSTKRMVVEACRENLARVCDQCYNYYNKECSTGLLQDTVMYVNEHTFLLFSGIEVLHIDYGHFSQHNTLRNCFGLFFLSRKLILFFFCNWGAVACGFLFPLGSQGPTANFPCCMPSLPVIL